MNDTARTTYRVIQKGVTVNEPVTDFDSLVTHHPSDNRNARMVDGVIVRAEVGRRHAYIGGEIQEVEFAKPGNSYGLKPDQVLLKKDFIIEHPDHPTMSDKARDVPVPSPLAGYVGRVDATQGLVDIYDKKDGDVIARVRHMSDIAVSADQTIEYGQSLGTQSNIKTGAKHVHLELDTRYYQQYENYIADLTNGRLPLEAEHRAGVQALPVVDDGVVRLGESGERVKDLQRVMADEGYRAVGDRPLDRDGVYRLSMQGALLDFQRDHGLPQTGDIDDATLQMAPMLPDRARDMDRPDHTVPGRWLPADQSTPTPTAPGHPDHRDHRPGLVEPLPPALNQSSRERSAGLLGPADLEMLEQIRSGVRKIDEGLGKPYDDASEKISRNLLAACRDNSDAYRQSSGYSLSENALTRVDHVVLGKSGQLFAVQGDLNDPAHKRAFVSVDQALATPVEQSDQKTLAANLAIEREKSATASQDLLRDDNLAQAAKKSV
ncbi:peptidoglycan-binding domain-containing protein [Pseudomonas sp. CGJS7]|uniref:peptidoglycan-binding domain-containing protein n=1 Tax=Pseudomonas sp. CGJS7 TaxID=3109348 RepID=UPI003008B94C